MSNLRSLPAPVRTLLDWHQRRRDGGVPTITTLAGPIGLSARCWRGWADPRPVSIVRTNGCVDDLVGAWLSDALLVCPCLELAHAWLARITNQSIAWVIQSTSGATRYDLDQLWRSLPVEPNGAVARVSRMIVEADARPDPLAFVQALSANGQAAAPVDLFRGVHGLSQEAQWPALLVMPAAEIQTAELLRVVSFLEKIAAAAPMFPVAVAVTQAQYGAIPAGDSSRAGAMAREGLIAVEGIGQSELEARLRSAGVNPLPAADAIRRLVAEGLSEDVAHAFVETARIVRHPTPDEIQSDFRSAPERFLFEQLESMVDTMGLFRPNVELHFFHGNKPAEADLVAERMKIVVEVDGGHYHLSQQQYRRDRRKDVLYQRHGYLVLRFLAEDVVDDLETVLTTILEVVSLRRDGYNP